MTHRAGVGGSGINRGWLVPIGFGAILLFLAGANILSRSMIIDFLAWWPVWLGVGLLHLLVRGRRFGMLRGAGIAPLLATPALVVFLLAHLYGWAVMPSASLFLIGPEPGDLMTASMVADVDGVLEVGGGGHHLYEVDPVRRGGPVGVAEAVEQVQGDAVKVDLRPAQAAGLDTFAGWSLSLTNTIPWDLELRGTVEADLTALKVTSLVVSGQGSIVLGAATALTPVSVTGDFDLEIPVGTQAEILGEATAPEGWEKTAEGWVSGAAGEGWVITVSHGSAVTVVDN